MIDLSNPLSRRRPGAPVIVGRLGPWLLLSCADAATPRISGFDKMSILLNNGRQWSITEQKIDNNKINYPAARRKPLQTRPYSKVRSRKRVKYRCCCCYYYYYLSLYITVTGARTRCRSINNGKVSIARYCLRT